MNPHIKDNDIDILLSAVLKIETWEECSDFFEDLCTVQELKALSQRIRVASMLMNGKVYSDIVAATGASTATISRVNRSLNYGTDGYKVVLERLGSDRKL